MSEDTTPEIETATPETETTTNETGSNLADRASRLMGQTKETLSKVNAGAALKSTDKYTSKFMAGVFKTLKILAALLSLGCLLAVAYALFSYATTTTPSVHAPVFDESMFESGSKGAGASRRKPSNEEFREIRNNFGDKIDDVIDAGSLDAKDDYNNIVEVLFNMDSSYRAEYINGARPFLKDFVAYYRRKGKEPTLEISQKALYLRYDAFFGKAVAAVEVEKQLADAKRAGYIDLAGSAILFLMMLVIMTLLIQIEENTRK
ncbi:MAG: hypothetical protein IJV65_01635 [Kiritimatiellae bacterium]|nr:hypothetical protein [Kiritimatiellia bacterium]